jgi:hypothetical protein
MVISIRPASNLNPTCRDFQAKFFSPEKISLFGLDFRFSFAYNKADFRIIFAIRGIGNCLGNVELLKKNACKRIYSGSS